MEKVKIYDSGTKPEVMKVVKISILQFHIPLLMQKMKKSTTISTLTSDFSLMVKKMIKVVKVSCLPLCLPPPNYTPSVSRSHARRSHQPKIGENINVSGYDIRIDSTPFTTQHFFQ